MRLLEVIWKTPWDLSRWVRLALGVFILIVAIKEADKMFLLLGMIPLAQALFNVSCCGGGNCYVNYHHHPTQNHEPEFEEIKNEQNG